MTNIATKLSAETVVNIMAGLVEDNEVVRDLLDARLMEMYPEDSEEVTLLEAQIVSKLRTLGISYEAKRAKEAEKRASQNSELDAKILEVMKDFGPESQATAKEIADAIGGVTFQKVSPRLKAMIEQSLVRSEVVKGKRVYTIILDTSIEIDEDEDELEAA